MPEDGAFGSATIRATLSRKEINKVFRVVLYAEDTAEARGIARQLEQDSGCELIALCATLADLNFVLDRLTVDVLLLGASGYLVDSGAMSRPPQWK